MSQDVTGLISWLRSWFDEIYALKGQGGNISLNDVYPVGSIYMSVNSVNPSTLFGGTWEQIEDKFLLASGTTYSNGDTGGSADAVVVTHNHTQNAHKHGTGDSTYTKFLATDINIAVNGTDRGFPSQSSAGHHYVYTDADGNIIEVTGTANATATNQSTGVSGTGKNMPPYLTVNVWKRIA